MDRRLLAICDARIWPSPDGPPIQNGTVLAEDGRIAEVGTDVRVPSEAKVISARGATVTAGFWNAHVHFTEPKWTLPARTPPATLESQLRDMLTSRGFTTVVDTGSDPRVTLALRERIRSGELVGPTVYTAGTGLYPPRGIPYYLRQSVPFWWAPFIPQPSTPRAAERVVERSVARGVDLVKLFTGSYVARGRVKPMPVAVAAAAVRTAHRHGRLVFSHPSNREGTQVAVDAGVDVLAHPPDMTTGVDASLLQRAVERRMAMIPTLKMFETTVSSDDGYLAPIYDVVRTFRSLGGPVLFGTDVGYMSDYRTDGEFRALARAGMDAPAILRSLTTAPAERFKVGADTGTIAPGKAADLVVLEGDPFEDVAAFAQVRATVRAGRVIWSKEVR